MARTMVGDLALPWDGEEQISFPTQDIKMFNAYAQQWLFRYGLINSLRRLMFNVLLQ